MEEGLFKRMFLGIPYIFVKIREKEKKGMEQIYRTGRDDRRV